jgi:hypothetical protein
MGCGASNDDVVNQKKGKKGAKGKKGGKSKAPGKPKNQKAGATDENESDDDEEEAPIVIVDAKPDILRKDIAKAYKAMSEKRERLRPQLRPYLGERRGLNALLEASSGSRLYESFSRANLSCCNLGRKTKIDDPTGDKGAAGGREGRIVIRVVCERRRRNIQGLRGTIKVDNAIAIS